MTTTNAQDETTPAQQDQRLESIALAVRGTYQTVEDMTQSFIRQAILLGVYRPGEKLNQDSIATTLGVSRMPVRASLRQLESEGLLRIHPHRGATVSVLRAEEIAEIYELRILLEGYLLERAIPKLTAEIVDELEQAVQDLEREHELPARLDRRKQFYQTLYQLAGRPLALADANNLRSSVGRYLLLQKVEEHLGHGGLIEHLRARDVQGAKTWLASHLAHVSQELQRLVAQEEQSTTG